MRCPTSSDFPECTPARPGWPWTTSAPHLPTRASAQSLLPRISIVTASYNQAPYLEETIRSVLLQGYPNLEYLVLDGGSTDGSVDIIRKYAPWLHYWVSEPDHGQVHALAKGFARSSGEILGFLNSDDVYFPGTLETVVRAFASNPAAVAICGNELWINADGQVISEEKTRSTSLRDLLLLNFLPQPAVFFRRSAYERAGGFDLQFQCIFDYELWLRLANCGEIYLIPQLLAATRWHEAVKRNTMWPVFAGELERAIPKVLAGPLSIALSPEERRAILANLKSYAAQVYLMNSPEYLEKALACSIAAIRSRPSAAPRLLRVVYSRMRQLSARCLRRVLRRDGSEKAWWTGRETGVHWADWDVHPPSI